MPEIKEPLTFTDNPSIYAHLEKKMILMEQMLSDNKTIPQRVDNPIELGIEPVFDENQSLHNHIWADRIGHIIEATSNAKSIILDAIKTGIYCGRNKSGNHVYLKVIENDGMQIWAFLTDDGFIKHLGANRPERHYTWLK